MKIIIKLIKLKILTKIKIIKIGNLAKKYIIIKLTDVIEHVPLPLVTRRRSRDDISFHCAATATTGSRAWLSPTTTTAQTY